MNPQIISFNCLLKNRAGKLISATYNRDVLNAIDADDAQLIALAQGLQNIKKGEKRKISISAEQAYGFYDPKKIILYPTRKLPKDIRLGQSIKILTKSGIIKNYVVSQFHNDLTSLDGNHPLAGQDLVFEIEALDVRDATDEEIENSNNSVSKQILH
ncbi:peptidylprolyl isomerase [Pseudobdellovibrio sp. HCB154]|uniref:FKBP-type peptidyl-prolyl cis-trans isomerase n=1 Tax=Pseudobdellovibrio sp. HCB154 TaxID=3386277 RepID=UPI003916DD22